MLRTRSSQKAEYKFIIDFVVLCVLLRSLIEYQSSYKINMKRNPQFLILFAQPPRKPPCNLNQSCNIQSDIILMYWAIIMCIDYALYTIPNKIMAIRLTLLILLSCIVQVRQQQQRRWECKTQHHQWSVYTCNREILRSYDSLTFMMR